MPSRCLLICYASTGCFVLDGLLRELFGFQNASERVKAVESLSSEVRYMSLRGPSTHKSVIPNLNRMCSVALLYSDNADPNLLLVSPSSSQSRKRLPIQNDAPKGIPFPHIPPTTAQNVTVDADLFYREADPGAVQALVT